MLSFWQVYLLQYDYTVIVYNFNGLSICEHNVDTIPNTILIIIIMVTIYFIYLKCYVVIAQYAK